MPSEFVTRTEPCPYCLRDTVVVTLELLLTESGEVVASVVVAKARCTRDACVGSRLPSR